MNKIIAKTKDEFYDKIKQAGYEIIDDDGKWLILDDGESTYEAEYTRYSDGGYELMLYNINKVKDKDLIVESSRKITSGLDPYLCCPNCGEPELFENIKEHNIKCYNCGNTISYDELKNLKKYVSPHGKITSARYIATDPESGEVLGSADTYEEAVNEWGEDVTITDSSIVENSRNPVKSSFDEDDDEIELSKKSIKSSISATALKEQLDGQFWTRAEDFEDEVNKAGWDIEDVNDEYATISNDKGSQYEVRFYDHGEGRTFTMESFKCIYRDEDDDEIESNYKFNQRIVNSVLSQKMTEQEAIQKIASRKDVNIGFARQIFNNLMNDKSLISSGTMEMASKLNQEFDLNGDLYSWFKDYVGNEGKASTIGGELVRAANQIINEYNQTGDGIGYGRGRETVNPAARFIIETCDDYSESRNMSDMLDETDDINYGVWIETFEKTFTDYLRDHEELFHQVNQDDFWGYAETGDKITSVDEFCTYDEDGNEYWFTRDENDDWICTEIEYEEKPLFKVNDAISETDNVAGKIDKTEPYGTFEENGFIYSYEADVDDEQGEYDHWVVTDVDRNDLKYHVDDKLNANDFEYEDIFDENGNEITYRDLF